MFFLSAAFETHSKLITASVEWLRNAVARTYVITTNKRVISVLISDMKRLQFIAWQCLEIDWSTSVDLLSRHSHTVRP